MINKVEIQNYKCIKNMSQDLNPFSVLIGPNASGKSTFLDAITLISDILNFDTIGTVIDARTPTFDDLLFNIEKSLFQITVESNIPNQFTSDYKSIRYEISVGFTKEKSIGITSETVSFVELKENEKQSPRSSSRKIVNKTTGGNDKFYSEKGENTSKEWSMTFKLGNNKSSFRFLPEDEEKFPIAIWLKDILKSQIKKIFLNSKQLQKPSPPTLRNQFSTDGSSLPWMVYKLKKENSDRYQLWIEHLQSILNDLQNVHVVERPEDKNSYILMEYANGLKVPSWNLSDGTLRLLFLTLLAYIPNSNQIYLIEEPENGIHPKAIETVLQSLSSIYDSQVILATHSPIVLNILKPKDLLCFSMDLENGTSIIFGDKHPFLQNYTKDISLGNLFAGGILG